jgi:hypothetical protein
VVRVSDVQRDGLAVADVSLSLIHRFKQALMAGLVAWQLSSALGRWRCLKSPISRVGGHLFGESVSIAEARARVSHLRRAPSGPQRRQPQDHPAGAEAEVDFGLFRAISAVSCCGSRSNRMRSNHARAFAVVTSVVGPVGHIRFDSLRAAVLRHEVQEAFRANARTWPSRRSHYRFDSFSCLPGIDWGQRRAASRVRLAVSAAPI